MNSYLLLFTVSVFKKNRGMVLNLTMNYNLQRQRSEDKLINKRTVLPDRLMIDGILYERKYIDMNDLVTIQNIMDTSPNGGVTNEDRNRTGYEYVPSQIHQNAIDKIHLEDVIDEKRGPFDLSKLHLDKELLTRNELLDLIKEALKIDKSLDRPAEDYLEVKTKGIPRTVASQVIDYIGELIYGPNNYIGPSKTGYAEGTLHDVITHTKALSVEDAEARAHDVLGTITDSTQQDEVLRGLMKTAQVARPIFVDARTGPPKISRNGQPRVSILLSGDVEENPGPIYKYDDPDKTKAEVEKNIDSPVSATSYLNANNSNYYVDERVYCNKPGQFALRSGLDNQTDNIQMNPGWIEVANQTFDYQLTPAVVSSFLQTHYQHYAVRNNFVHANLGDGTLGKSLASSLVSGVDFLSAERTNANLVSGDANLGIYTRAIKNDYGMFLPCAKLMLYESYKMLNSGQNVDSVCIDRIFRTIPTQDLNQINRVYPLSENRAPAAAPINAYLLNSQEYADMQRGIISWPEADPNDTTVAVVIVPAGMDPSTINYLTLCFLEYPYFQCEAQCEEVTMAANGGVPIITASQFVVPTIANCTRIDGPRNTVYFVSAALNVGAINLITVGGVALPILLYNPAAPVAVNIEPALNYYIDNTLTVTGQTTEYTAVFDHLLRFMDLGDWRAAVLVCASIIRQKVITCHLNSNTNSLNDVTPYFYNGQAAATAPMIDASLRTQAYGTGLNATIIQGLASAVDHHRHFNCFGVPITELDNGIPPIGTAFPGIPISMYVTDAVHSTYYSVFTKMAAKKVLNGTEFLENTRVRFRQMWFMIKSVSDIISQCSHNFYQDCGAQQLDITMRNNNVSDVRQNMFASLSSFHDFFLAGLTGWVPMQMELPQNDDLRNSTTVIVGAQTYFSYIRYMQTPIYIFNHLEFSAEKEWYYGKTWQPMPSFNMNELSRRVKRDWIPDQRGGTISFSSLIISFDGFIRSDTLATFGPNGDGGWQQELRELYAAFSTTVAHNPLVLNSMADLWLLSEAGGVVYLRHRPLILTNQFLRWTASSSTSDAFRDSTRQGFVIMAPYYPAEFDSGTGSRLFMSLRIQDVLNQLRRMYSVVGSGSAQFSMTLATRPPIMSRLLRRPGLPVNKGADPNAPVNNPGKQPGEV